LGIVKNSCPVLVVGDFNLPKIDWQNLCVEASENSREHSFLSAVVENHFFQHVIKPTRLRSDQTPSTLDLVLTKSSNFVSNIDVCPPLGKSDHIVLEISLRLSIPEVKSTKIWYDYAKADYDGFKKFIIDLNLCD